MLLVCLPYAVYLAYGTVQLLQIFQLEEYDAARFWHWLLGNRSRAFDRKEIWTQGTLLGLGIISCLLPGRAFTWVSLLLLILWASSHGCLVLQLSTSKVEVKRKLVLTSRAIRLLSTTVLIQFLTAGMGAWICLGPLWINPLAGGAELHWRVVLFMASMLCLSQLRGPTIILANYLLWPLEVLVRWLYLRSARVVISRSNAIVIGITGSFGKTSTKEILAHLLSRRYRVLKTPETYNTLMGICKVVRTALEPDHEFFVVEMGAYKRGEIKAICDLVSPVMGIVTAIGPQHLERFGTLENIMSAKNELAEALGEDGVAFYNTDYDLCRQLAATAECEVVTYSSDGDEEADIVARHIDVSPRGTDFSIRTLQWGEVELNTRLLGRHNVANLLAAIAVAMEVGIGITEVRDALKTLQPLAHRLQLLDGEAGVVVIDDAYSANPVGAHTALDVLSQFNSGARILVTPGLVELGQLEYEENWKLGLKAAEICDFVILIGPKRTSPIQEALRVAGFPEEKLRVCLTVSEATSVLAEILRPCDTVLFENDLPDQYLEIA